MKPTQVWLIRCHPILHGVDCKPKFNPCLLFVGGVVGSDCISDATAGTTGDAREDREAGGAVVLPADQSSSLPDAFQHRRHPAVRCPRLHDQKTSRKFQRISLHMYFRFDHYFPLGCVPPRLFHSLLHLPPGQHLSILFNSKRHRYLIVLIRPEDLRYLFCRWRPTEVRHVAARGQHKFHFRCSISKQPQ